jgi:general secretion pathway protein A
MYESFFGLDSQPFGMTPDPRFYFQGSSHREALAGLQYGIQQRRGFLTLVGEVGTGKTTLITTLLEGLDRSTCTILVTHTTIDREELLRIILHKLHEAHGPRLPASLPGDEDSNVSVRLSGLSRIELINEFSAFVNGEFMAYRPPPILVIDEAQNLSVKVLEEVRLLTNLEGPKSKLLQVLLAGQPELEEKLLRTDLRQLRQRVAVSVRLEPFDHESTGEYIRHRLKQAGSADGDLFSDEAVDAIWHASNGFPRTINVLCDYSLVNAYGAGQKQVIKDMAEEAINDVLCLRSEMDSLEKPKPYLVTNLAVGEVQVVRREVPFTGLKQGEPGE